MKKEYEAGYVPFDLQMANYYCCSCPEPAFSSKCKNCWAFEILYIQDNEYPGSDTDEGTDEQEDEWEGEWEDDAESMWYYY